MKFFNSEADRQLWIRLNAEHQIEWEKGLTYFDTKTGEYKPTLQARNPRTMEEALEVAENQLLYDEAQDKLRYTLEDYLLLSNEQLEAKRLKEHQEWCRKFEALGDKL